MPRSPAKACTSTAASPPGPSLGPPRDAQEVRSLAQWGLCALLTGLACQFRSNPDPAVPEPEDQSSGGTDSLAGRPVTTTAPLLGAGIPGAGWSAPGGRRLARVADTPELTGGERPRRADIGATTNKHADIARDDATATWWPHANPTLASSLTPGGQARRCSCCGGWILAQGCVPRDLNPNVSEERAATYMITVAAIAEFALDVSG